MGIPRLWRRVPAVIGGFVPGVSEYLAVRDFAREPSWLNAGIIVLSIADLGSVAKQLGREIHSLEKGARRHEKVAAEHEARAKAFREDPTVRPGMEGQSESEIQRQQGQRASDLEAEAKRYRANAQRKRDLAEEKKKQLAQIKEAEALKP